MAQGNGGVTVPGGTLRCVAVALEDMFSGAGLQAGLDLRGFFQPEQHCDS